MYGIVNDGSSISSLRVSDHSGEQCKDCKCTQSQATAMPALLCVSACNSFAIQVLRVVENGQRGTHKAYKVFAYTVSEKHASVQRLPVAQAHEQQASAVTAAIA
jgi:hypothetical protein